MLFFQGWDAKPMVKALLTGVALAALAVPSQALAASLFVSGKGADAAGCGATSKPCRTFQYAHDLAPAGSQIAVLDSGEFGPVVISKAISIVNDGAGVAGVTYTGAGAAIAIKAGLADRVLLRGLSVNGEKKGATGLNLSTAGTLDITNCSFDNFALTGAVLGPAGRSQTLIGVANSQFSGNRVGLRLGGTAVISTSITNSQFNLNRDSGLFVGSGNLGTTLVISGGRIFGNNTGIAYFAASGNSITVSGVTISGNQTYGINVASGELTLRGSTLSENGVDLAGPAISSATLKSTGDNTTFASVQGNLPIVAAPLK